MSHKAILWSEKAPFPHICTYHLEGCQCDSPQGIDIEEVKDGHRPETCDYCRYGCKCEEDCNCECRCCNCEDDCDCAPLLIDAASYNKWVRQTCFLCPSGCLTDEMLTSSETVKHCLENIGEFQFYVRVLPYTVKRSIGWFFAMQEVTVRAQLKVIQEDDKAKVEFTDSVYIPIIEKKGQVWMSLAPNEIYTQREGLDLAHGRVLIAGLGMGWLTMRVCEKPEVTSVVQLEIDPGIANFVGPPLQERFSDKLSIIVDNVYNYLAQTSENFDVILFDIWPDYRDARFDRKFKQLIKSSRADVWGWGYY